MKNFLFVAILSSFAGSHAIAQDRHIASLVQDRLVTSLDECQVYNADRDGRIQLNLSDHSAVGRNFWFAGAITAQLYAASASNETGNNYRTINSHGDSIVININDIERYSGRLNLAPDTVARIHALAGGSEGVRESVCIDGVMVDNAVTSGDQFASGNIILYAEDSKAIMPIISNDPVSLPLTQAPGSDGR
jgi:hypothetical protein